MTPALRGRPSTPIHPANLAGCCGRIAVGITENSRKGRVTRGMVIPAVVQQYRPAVTTC